MAGTSSPGCVNPANQRAGAGDVRSRGSRQKTESRVHGKTKSQRLTGAGSCVVTFPATLGTRAFPPAVPDGRKSIPDRTPPLPLNPGAVAGRPSGLAGPIRLKYLGSCDGFQQPRSASWSSMVRFAARGLRGQPAIRNTGRVRVAPLDRLSSGLHCVEAGPSWSVKAAPLPSPG